MAYEDCCLMKINVLDFQEALSSSTLHESLFKYAALFVQRVNEMEPVEISDIPDTSENSSEWLFAALEESFGDLGRGVGSKYLQRARSNCDAWPAQIGG
mmetsp:Transcript_31649/g.79895  ORF Transcript_31649/g.79895 Transcript_31649/m.79895 type:complete len:99 (-) Transcript_31649:25-321(-)